jgi:biopolymer transport protein ExbD
MALASNDDGNGIFASINITPLTDIFLVLLIIFMVATGVTIESAAHVELPRLHEAAHSDQQQQVIISYTADHQIFVDGKHVSEHDLASALRSALSRSPNKTVVFDGAPSAILGDMVRIVDIAKSAGADQIALAVAADSDQARSAVLPTPSGDDYIPEPVTPQGEAVPEPAAPIR